MSVPQAVPIFVGMNLREVERTLILATLHEFWGDKRRTAAVLGISVKTLYNRLHQYKLPLETRDLREAIREQRGDAA